MAWTYPNIAIAYENIGEEPLDFHSVWDTRVIDPLPPEYELAKMENDDFDAFADQVRYRNGDPEEKSHLPAHSSSYTKGIPGPPLDQAEVDRMKSGQAALLTTGIFQYFNSKRKPLEVCILWGRNPQSARTCRDHNVE